MNIHVKDSPSISIDGNAKKLSNQKLVSTKTQFRISHHDWNLENRSISSYRWNFAGLSKREVREFFNASYSFQVRSIKLRSLEWIFSSLRKKPPGKIMIDMTSVISLIWKEQWGGWHLIYDGSLRFWGWVNIKVIFFRGRVSLGGEWLMNFRIFRIFCLLFIRLRWHFRSFQKC